MEGACRSQTKHYGSASASACHVMNSAELSDVPGMRGLADGGILDGRWGYEAGQSGVGDIFGWFVNNGVPTAYSEAAAARGIGLHEYLTELPVPRGHRGRGSRALRTDLRSARAS